MQAGGPGGKQPTAGGGPKGTFKNPRLSSSPGSPAKKPTTGGKRPVMPVKAGGSALRAQQKQAQMLGGPSRRPKGGPTKQAPRRGSVKSPGGPLRSGTGGGAAPAPRGLRGATMARSGTGGSAATPSRRPARSPLAAQKAQVAATGRKRTAAQQQRRKARLASMTPAQRQRRQANMKTLQGMTPAQRRQRRQSRPAASRRNMRGR